MFESFEEWLNDREDDATQRELRIIAERHNCRTRVVGQWLYVECWYFDGVHNSVDWCRARNKTELAGILGY